MRAGGAGNVIGKAGGRRESPEGTNRDLKPVDRGTNACMSTFSADFLLKPAPTSSPITLGSGKCRPQKKDGTTNGP